VFDDRKIEIKESIEARKKKISDDVAWDLLSVAEEIIIGKGKKVIAYNPAKDSKKEILASSLGRTGNLRAPTLKIGNRFIVGYNVEMYEQYVK
jgi:hypothetical protein